MTAIETLDLSSNHLTEFPEEIFAMKSLRRLDLSRTAIRTIPPQLAKLRLVKLDVSCTRLRSFPQVVLDIDTLEDLDVTALEVRLKSIPDDIGKLKRLRRLVYRNHDIAEFPPALFTLANLEALDLGFCSLPDEIPPELARLTKLRSLGIAFSSWKDRRADVLAVAPLAKGERTTAS
jgi:Leucine-rich repeat (LRR) protein